MTTSDMSNDDISTITFRLPAIMREKIKINAAIEERSESGWIRFHIGRILSMAEAETNVDEGGQEP